MCGEFEANSSQVRGIGTNSSQFYGGGSAAVDLLFNVLPIVCGGSVYVFVLLCIPLCPI